MRVLLVTAVRTKLARKMKIAVAWLMKVPLVAVAARSRKLKMRR